MPFPHSTPVSARALEEVEAAVGAVGPALLLAELLEEAGAHVLAEGMQAHFQNLAVGAGGLIVLYTIFSRQLIRGLTAGAVKS